MAVLKYEEIAESLRTRIAAGEFAPGATIPSGRDLAEQWDVSRATAIKAVDVLRNDGVVVAKQGTGFVVTETPVARPAGARRAGSARILGGMPFLRVGTPDWAEPPARVAVALGIAPGVLALRRIRVLQLPDGTPNSCVEAWFPPEIAEAAPRLADTAPIAEGTTRYVRRQTGRFPVEGVDITTVRLATDKEAERLNIATATPVAVLLHTARDEEGRPLVCEEGVTPSSLFEQVDTYAM
ncbi:GntR family transcriptional regulator [Streptomyces triticiradicis]|uniref:GntR family transcriptional regulator n=1 Tax=Streptomyces triticiradicis TaxID=2651189 RepID=A0A7J5D8Y4_9ACTN|nr:GntR family transcriptional regulator [Streptomyces triticiradicis]KAB1983482.1 GntR family transcriptional regulator [Streptomyces triticiradicis]